MKREIKRNLALVESAAAIACFVGGILAGLLGTLLSASAWILGGEQHPLVHGLGTALLVVTIPLLILAGYCMDWLERDSKQKIGSTAHR